MEALDCRQVAETALHGSELSKTTIANGLALLRRAHPHNGHVTMSWESLCDLFGVSSRGAARKHLTRLMEAGIIHYSTNAAVYVTFAGWSALDEDDENLRVETPNLRVETPKRRVDAPILEEEAEDDEGLENETARGNSKTARGNSKTARGRADENAYKELMFVCLFVDPTTPLEELINKQTNNQRIAYELLVDAEVGIAPLLAADMAAGYSLEEIQRQVFAWRRDLQQGRVQTVGALITRLRRGFTARAPTDEERETGLWLRHFAGEARSSRYSLDGYDDLIIR